MLYIITKEKRSDGGAFLSKKHVCDISKLLQLIETLINVVCYKLVTYDYVQYFTLFIPAKNVSFVILYHILIIY